MHNLLVRAICKKLNEIDNRKYKIYIDTVIQGLKTPAFSVMCTQVVTNSNAYAQKYSYQMAIHYYSDKDDKKAHNDCADMIENVCMRIKNVTISIEDKELCTYANNIKCNIADGVLTVTFSYDLFASSVELINYSDDEIVKNVRINIYGNKE